MPDLAGAIEPVIAHDRNALELDAARYDRSKVEIRGHDSDVDRTLGTIQSLLSHYAGGGNPIAAKLLGALFPNGLAAHVHLPFIEQAAANERVLKILEGNGHAQWLDAHGVRPLIDELRAHHDKFEAALEARDAVSVPSWDDVKQARERGQELYLEIVARIVWEFRAEPELRDELLEPIWNQEQLIAQYRRLRRAVVDVNPDTGEDLEPGDEPSEPEPLIPAVTEDDLGEPADD